MISAQALDRAVAQEVVTAEQALQLRAIEAALESDAREPTDDENLRFLTGFADIFVTIGLVLFLGALAFLMNAGTGSTLMYAGLAACSWVLAEFFTFKRRMALPSIVLLVVFVGAIFVLAAQIAATLLPPTASLFHDPIFKGWLFTPNPHGPPPPQSELRWPDWLPLCVAGIVAAAMAAIHYVRFRVPITIAAGAAPLCVLVVALVAGLMPSAGETPLNLTLLALGLAVFALAMRFDMSDPERRTRATDIAFWLHLLAAPLIVHPLIRGFLHGMDARLTPGAAAGILWVFLALGAVAVIIDRRAILVSALVYAGIAYGSLVRALGVESYTVPIVLLSLGGFILLLSAGWQPLRRVLLRRLPPRLAGRLPHPLVVSNA